ncbi:MAG: hypothetical protein WAP35_03645, partial [Solirubrobacterales bacterium]
MIKNTFGEGRLKLIVACVAAALATIGVTSALALAGSSGDARTSAKGSTFTKAELKLVKKYASSYARRYARAGATGATGAVGANG